MKSKPACIYLFQVQYLKIYINIVTTIYVL